MNPLEPTGSYAGAMGIPQFMPSSFRAYAADFEDDKKKDIWDNPADAIASVANYFKIHKWHKEEPIVFPVTAKGDVYRKFLTKGTKPDIYWAELQLEGIEISSEQKLKANEAIKLFSFQQEKSIDLWVGLNNFYVITRYNRSPLYAMAVYQLSEAIHKKRLQSSSDKKAK
jgi:membrane-bound lytic murein transglycosylase B